MIPKLFMAPVNGLEVWHAEVWAGPTLISRTTRWSKQFAMQWLAQQLRGRQ